MFPMHQASGSELTDNQRSRCADLMSTAEREFAAFFSAVTELFGSEQAGFSVEDWLDELVSMDAVHGLRSCDCRQVTVAASIRLASRLDVASKPIE